MQDSLAGLRAEHASLQEQLSDSAVHSNPALSKKLNRRYAELSTILEADAQAKLIEQDLAAAKELATEDASFAEELPKLEEQLEAAQERLMRLLIPRDPDDGRDAILEIKAGEGGAESALFAGDLLRMYLHYAASKAGLINLTRSLAKLYSGKGVTTNAVAIGLVQTDMSAAELATEAGQEKAKAIPRGRLGTLQDIADAVACLASDQADYITGQTINLNGGMYC